MQFQLQNTLAKIAIVAWISFLLYAAAHIAKSAVTLDPNAYFGLRDPNRLPADAVREIKVLVLMLAVSIVGGLSFIIKDFYRSVKYANVYDRAYADFRSGGITRDSFQRLITVEIYSGRFNYTWVYWFLVQPVLSSVLGVIAFFIARSGLGVIQGAGDGPEITIRSLYLYAVFTFLAGFSSHKFIAWLDRLADKIFSTTLPEATADKRLRVEDATATDLTALRSEIGQPSESSVPIPDGLPDVVLQEGSPSRVPEPSFSEASESGSEEVPVTHPSGGPSAPWRSKSNTKKG